MTALIMFVGLTMTMLTGLALAEREKLFEGLDVTNQDDEVADD